MFTSLSMLYCICFTSVYSGPWYESFPPDLFETVRKKTHCFGPLFCLWCWNTFMDPHMALLVYVPEDRVCRAVHSAHLASVGKWKCAAELLYDSWTNWVFSPWAGLCSCLWSFFNPSVMKYLLGEAAQNLHLCCGNRGDSRVPLFL